VSSVDLKLVAGRKHLPAVSERDQYEPSMNSISPGLVNMPCWILRITPSLSIK
jgi:hypothetical protein